MGLGNILMDIVGYKYATPMGVGISRRVRRRQPRSHDSAEHARNPFAHGWTNLCPTWDMNMSMPEAALRRGFSGAPTLGERGCPRSRVRIV